MNRFGRALIVLAVAALGVWGCSQASGAKTGQQERIHALETKCGKLEDDYKAVAAQRDQARKRAAAFEEDCARLEEKRKKEADEARQFLDARAAERDCLQVRCDRLKHGLQALLGQDDALAVPAAAPPAAVSAAAANGAGGS
jgi:hypothetical protein